MPALPFLLPPAELQSRLDARTCDARHLAHLPELETVTSPRSSMLGRRGLLRALGAGLLASTGFSARGAEPLVFDGPTAAPSAGMPQVPHEEQPVLQLGQIPADFWQRPRELHIHRQGTQERIQVVYWKDGSLVPEGYWQACALLRDVKANRMTSMDPTILDVLRGVLGYYEAWKWPHPLVITSGFRTVQTNNALAAKGEGAAKNSMHLYGRAADVYMPGASVRDIGLLAMHLQRGGVGFYPAKGFTHIDTGRLRTWRG